MRPEPSHPLLGKARPVDQCRLDGGPGRTQYGTTEVLERDVATALTAFAGMPGTGPVWSLNPYAGCQHRCAYCYVPKTLHAERARWGGYVVVKRNLVRRLEHDLKRRPPGTVYLSTATDPYQPLEAERRLTRESLVRLRRAGWPVDVLTRSPLLLRDLDQFRAMPHLRVGLSVPTLDDAVRRQVEPAAPPIDARLDALHRLAAAGLTVYANYAPAHPMTDGFTPRDVAQTFADLGVQWVNTSPWRYQEDTLPAMRRCLPGDVLPRFADDRRQRGLRAALARAFEDADIPLRDGFFSPPTPWPAPRPAHAAPPAGAASAVPA